MQAEHYGLAGVGFGPSHLALAALHDSTAVGAQRARLCCLEARPGFAWHPDMLLDGSRMQVAFAKDLVTPVDPTSRYSFLNYLAGKGRLEQFLNLGTLFPSRHEFVDYFSWVAGQLSAYVRYDSIVRRVRPVPGPDGIVRALELDVTDQAGRSRVLSADHVSIAPGGTPVIPHGIDPALIDSGAVFHSGRFRTSVARFHERGRDLPYRFLVVGAGQSAAEIFRYLASAFPVARVHLACRGFALMPANNSALANEIFNPEMVDLFYGSAPECRRQILTDLRGTNYAAVDDADIQAIAGLLYDQRAQGGDRLRLLRFTELARCQERASVASVTLRDVRTGTAATDWFDGVVLATGYDFRGAGGLLTDLEPHLLRDPDGALRIGRNYAVATVPSFRSKVFLHGAAEHTHGLTATLLSLIARRAADILAAAFGATNGAGPADVPSLQGVEV